MAENLHTQLTNDGKEEEEEKGDGDASGVMLAPG